MAHYQSEITNFLNEIKGKDPKIEQGQIEGRALLWDKSPMSPDEQRRAKAAKIAQKPYVYSNE
jgi:hypothetical protein